MRQLTVSKMTVEPKTNTLIGLALFLTNSEGDSELDLLFVSPNWQRRGVASEMAAAAVNELVESGSSTLYSTFHICNEQSRAWHLKFGFAELPDQMYCRLKYSWYKHEIWRNEKLGALENVEELKRNRDHWLAQLDEVFKNQVFRQSAERK